MQTKWLKIKAGKKAYQRLMEHGIRQQDVKVVPGAAGGPKWLTLYALDKYLIQDFLPGHTQDIHFIGSSAGAWRAACYVNPRPEKSLENLHQYYIHQSYTDENLEDQIQATCKNIVQKVLGAEGIPAALNPGKRFLHVITSRAKFFTRGATENQVKFQFTKVAASSILSRPLMQRYVEREIFSNCDLHFLREDVLQTYATRIGQDNLAPALLASGSIPLKTHAVLMNGKEYWDGGIVDYHIDLNFKIEDGLVFYPHFISKIYPGWFDKFIIFRTSKYHENTVLLYPSDAHIKSLPNQKLTDLKDFYTYADNNEERFRVWKEAAKRGEQLVEDFIKLQNIDVLRANLEMF